MSLMAATDETCRCLEGMVENLITHRGSVKCIYDDDEVIFTDCVVRFLLNLHIKSGAADLITDAIDRHHQLYSCSSKTLLLLVCHWLQSLLPLRTQGVPVSQLLQTCHEAVEKSVEHLLKHATQQPTLFMSNCHRKGQLSNSLTPVSEAATLTGDIFQPQQTSVDDPDHSISRGKHSTTSEQITRDIHCVHDDSGLNEDDNEDLGWFFDGGKVPDLTREFGIVSELLEHAKDEWNCGIKENEQIQLSNIVSSPQLMNGAKAVRSVDTSISVPSIRSHRVDSDDDFEDCFEEVSRDLVSLSNNPSCKDENGSSLYCVAPNENEQCSSDTTKSLNIARATVESRILNRHFTSIDNCVTELQNTSVDNTESSISLLRKSSLKDDQFEDCTEASNNQINKKKKSGFLCATSAENEPSLKNTNESLDNNSGSTSATVSQMSLGSRILNRSRHFTSIDNCVTELQQTAVKNPEASIQGSAFKDLPMLDDSSKVNCISRTNGCSGASNTDKNHEMNIINVKNTTNDLLKPSELMPASAMHSLEHSKGEKHPMNNVKQRLDMLEVQHKLSQNNASLSRKWEPSSDSGQTLGETSLYWLVQCLCHGNKEIVPLVTEVLERQLKQDTLASVDLSVVYTCVTSGPRWDKSRVVTGIVVSCSVDQLAVCTQGPCDRNTLLIHGDLRPSFTHKGHQVKQQTTRYNQTVGGSSRNDQWLQKVQETLSKLCVRAVLCTGTVDPDFQDICLSHGVLLVPQVSYRVLQSLAHSRGTNISVYITDCSQEDVVSSVTYQPYTGDWGDGFNSTGLLVIETPHNHGNHSHHPQTVVLCHPCLSVAMMRDEHFWHCAKRVSSCLHDNKMVAGAGVSEKLCAQFLESEADKTEQNKSITIYTENPFTPVIYRSVAEGFHHFWRLLHTHNMDPDGTTPSTGNQDHIEIHQDFIGSTSDFARSNQDLRVYDDYTSKVEAWRTACHVTCQLLLLDKEIISGLTTDQTGVTVDL